MKISVFGLGYVGCVGLGCLARLGHYVTGVDVQSHKVDLINSGKATIVEKDIDELIREGVDSGRIRAVGDHSGAVLESDISFICIGTPTNEKGYLDLSALFNVASDIGTVLKQKEGFHVIAIRSTVMPGACEKVSGIIEEKSGKKENEGFAVVANPEFLREGSAVRDFFTPPYILIAGGNKVSGDMLRDVYRDIDADVVDTDRKTGEIIKLVNNSFHAMKISFANEIGRVCKKLGIDSKNVMNLICRDTELNISPAYLRPGFAYGGSCLPKDLKALHSLALDHRAYTPLVDSIEESNSRHIEFAKELIMSKGKKRIGFLGLSFKTGTDDLRFSPALDVVEHFLGKGYQISVYDPNINLSRIMGKNKEYLMSKLPHIAELLEENIEDMIKSCELVVMVNGEKSFKEFCDKNSGIMKGMIFIDLSGSFSDMSGKVDYEGICW